MSLGAVDIIVLLGMAFGFLLLPLGFPGLWIMAAFFAGAVLAGQASVLVLVVLLVVAAAAELGEFFILQRLNLRYGGSNRAFWGAALGGLIGVFVGLPIPILGPVLGGLLGTFAGAMVVTIQETRALREAAQVGWGTLVGRLWTTAAKMAVGALSFALAATNLLLR